MFFDQVNSSFYTKEQQELLAQAHIGIAGAGGLGSNCAMILARAGVTHFTLIDFDEVNTSNLNRQFYFASQINEIKVEALAQNLKNINPDISLTIYNQRVTASNAKELLKRSSIVIEAFDTPQSKATLAQIYLFDSQTPFICVSGIAGFGNSDRIITQEVGRNSWLIGDTSTGVDKAPPLAPAVLIAAAKEADKVLEIILLNTQKK